MFLAAGRDCAELQVEMALKAQMLLLNFGARLEPLSCCCPKSPPLRCLPGEAPTAASQDEV